jgi:hypothetical protein
MTTVSSYFVLDEQGMNCSEFFVFDVGDDTSIHYGNPGLRQPYASLPGTNQSTNPKFCKADAPKRKSLRGHQLPPYRVDSVPAMMIRSAGLGATQQAAATPCYQPSARTT